jgi:hypothetical protein
MPKTTETQPWNFPYENEQAKAKSTLTSAALRPIAMKGPEHVFERNANAKPVMAMAKKDLATIDSGNFTFRADFSKLPECGSDCFLAVAPGRIPITPELLKGAHYMELSEGLWQFIPGVSTFPVLDAQDKPMTGYGICGYYFNGGVALPFPVQRLVGAADILAGSGFVETPPTNASTSVKGNKSADDSKENNEIDVPCEHCGCTPGIEEYQESIINNMEEDQTKKAAEYESMKRKEDEGRIMFALELEKLRRKAEASKSVLGKLTEKLETIQNERDNANTRLKAALETSKRWEAHNRATEAELNEVRQRQGYSKADLDKIESRLRDSQSQLGICGHKLKEALEKSAALEIQVTALNKGLERFRGKFESQRALATELQQKLQNSENEQASLDKKLKNVLANSDVLPEQLEAAELEKEELITGIIALTKDLDVVKNDLRVSQEENMCLNDKNAGLVKDYQKLETEVAELKAAREDNGRKLKEMQKELGDAIRCRNTLKEKAPEDEETVRRLEESLSTLRSANQTLARDANYLDTKFRSASKTRDELQKRLRIHLADNDALRAQIEESRRRFDAKDTECKTLQKEIAELQDIHKTLATSDKKYEYAKDNQILKAQNKNLMILNKDLASSLKDEKDNNLVLQNKYKDLTSKFNVLKQDNFKSTVTQEATIQELRTKVVELEKNRVLMTPFIQSMADARLGFLESAKFVAGQGQNDEIRWKAQHAFHHGNGRLDATLFKTGLVPKDYREAATKIFEGLYAIPPSRYGGWGPKSARIGDCQATLKSLTPFCHKEPLWGKAMEFQQVMQFLNQLLGSMTSKAFEASQQVETWVVRLETLADEIAEVVVARERFLSCSIECLTN